MINPALLQFLQELEQNNNKAWFNSVDHPAIEFLRLKSYAAIRGFSDEEVVRDDFNDELLTAYEALSKLNAFLDSAR